MKRNDPFLAVGALALLLAGLMFMCSAPRPEPVNPAGATFQSERAASLAPSTDRARTEAPTLTAAASPTVGATPPAPTVTHTQPPTNTEP